MNAPVVFQYQRALDLFRRQGREPPLLKRMSELISLLDLSTTLNSSLSNDEILNAALLIVMGELQTTRGALFVRVPEGYQLKAGRGLPAEAPTSVPALDPDDSGVVLRDSARNREPFDAFGLEVISPILKAGRPIALLGLGARSGGRVYGEEELGFLLSVAACAGAPIENGLIHNELRELNRRLSLKVFQLNSLFDISRELTVSPDEEAIKNLVTGTVMGQLAVSRCELYLAASGGLALAHERGLRGQAEATLVAEEEARPVLESLLSPLPVSDLPAGAFKERLLRKRMALAVPISSGDRVAGLLAVGGRVSGAPFAEEDLDFAVTLGRQAMAALESVRLHQVRLEKLRQDRELEIARQIQRSLFPDHCPDLPGFQVAALSQSCYQVGGDLYDFISLSDGRLALAIADVAGKGTPASILMASVHASLRALAGTASPGALVCRLNRFLLESTQDNKFVTLFYAELEPGSGLLRFVNAGHVPPYWLREDGSRRRLESGGPVLGLLDQAAYEEGEAHLAAGDLVAMVTDGVTEALSPTEEEFGDERVAAALQSAAAGSVGGVVARLISEVTSWTGSAGCTDDLTVLILQAGRK